MQEQGEKSLPPSAFCGMAGFFTGVGFHLTAAKLKPQTEST